MYFVPRNTHNIPQQIHKDVIHLTCSYNNMYHAIKVIIYLLGSLQFLLATPNYWFATSVCKYCFLLSFKNENN